jgi:hypothetical protein
MNLLRYPSRTCRTAWGTSVLMILIPAWTFAGMVSEPYSSPPEPRTADGITEWSSPVNELSVRVQYTPTVEYADPIDVKVELCQKSSLPHVFLPGDHAALNELRLTLRLIDLHTGTEHEYLPSDQATCLGEPSVTDEAVWSRSDSSWSGCFRFKVDCDPRVVNLDRYNRDSTYFWREAREVVVHESLPLGTYAARLEIFGPQPARGGWHGLLTSAPFTLTIEGQDAGKQERSFVFPRGLRLVKGPVVNWEPDDVDTVRIETSPHHFLEFRITSDYGDLRAPGLPEAPAILLNRDLPWQFAQSPLSLKPKKRIVFVDGTIDMSWHFELVESVLAPGKNRCCTVSDRHSRLWEADLSIGITKSLFDSLTVTESEVYDYHTIIVPSSLRHDPEDNLRFEAKGAVLREARCPRGYHINSKVTVGSDSVIWTNGPDLFPVLPFPSGTTNSSITFRFEIYACDPSIADPADLDSWNSVLLWSGRSEVKGTAREFVFTEEYSQPEPETWPMRTHHVPGSLQMTDDMELIRAPTDSIEITLIRSPGTALLAAITSGNVCSTQLPPDLEGVTVELTSASLWGDTLTCRLDLYERPVGSTVFGSYETLWSHQYKVPLTKNQAKKLRKHIEKQEPSMFPRGTGVSFR